MYRKPYPVVGAEKPPLNDFPGNLAFECKFIPEGSTGFSPFELLFSRKLQGIFDLIKENWEKDQTPAHNEIQYVLDLGPKLHWRGCHEKHQQRLHKRGARLTGKQSPSSSKLLAKCQRPFVVAWQEGDVDYEMVWSERGRATQIYHLNLKVW